MSDSGVDVSSRAAHSGFKLFYLLQSPGNTIPNAEVTLLRPSPAAPIVKTHRVQPHSRFNLWVDLEDTGLAATDVSAVIRVTDGLAIIVERAMYSNAGGVVWAAGSRARAARLAP